MTCVDPDPRIAAVPRSTLLADVARVADAHGGRFTVTTHELLMLARGTGGADRNSRRPPPQGTY